MAISRKIRKYRNTMIFINIITIRKVFILTEPEPAKEEIFEYSIISRWLLLYGIHPYRRRVSGHYYPFEIGEILRLSKFKEILPVHTEHPNILLQYSSYYNKQDVI